MRSRGGASIVFMFGLLSVVGYGILLSGSSSGVSYFGCFLVAFGLYVVTGLPLAWLPSNCPRYGKRTTATGLQLTIANASGIMAPFCKLATREQYLWRTNVSFFYPVYETAEGPRFIRG